MLEIDCPENCPYLIAGRERDIADYSRRIGRLNVGDHERNSRVFKDHQDVIAQLEYAIARERLSSRDLTDKDVAQAVGVLLDTYKTEANGVLYEKASEDLRVEPLRRELKAVIESLRNPEGSEATRRCGSAEHAAAARRGHRLPGNHPVHGGRLSDGR